MEEISTKGLRKYSKSKSFRVTNLLKTQLLVVFISIGRSERCVYGWLKMKQT